jgi:hypothetical protein
LNRANGEALIMKEYIVEEYTFEALCLHTVSEEVDTLAYLIGLVDSEKHVAGNPFKARYDILYPLSEGEGQVVSPEDLVGMQAEFLPSNYLPQTPVMFARRWSPITALLEKGFKPFSLARDARNAPTAVAAGIWRPGIVEAAKDILDCTTDEELFWAIMSKVFDRARDRDWLVSIIAEVGWSYDTQVGRLQDWSDEEIAQTGRVLWKSTVDG